MRKNFKQLRKGDEAIGRLQKTEKHLKKGKNVKRHTHKKKEMERKEKGAGGGKDGRK